MADLVELLGRSGPQTGAELLAQARGDTFHLWQACRTTAQLTVRRVGRRYVRLDRKVDGYARLSPSIQREFLTYTVVGLADDAGAVEERAEALAAHIRQVSRRKLDLAREVMGAVVQPFGEEDLCVLVAGDVVYGMAHDVARPERSTGTMVAGSDLDIVVLVRDGAPEELVSGVDAAIYKEKYRYLTSPAFREEIDYVVKRFAALRDQAKFDTFRRMVACKILDEAELLLGSAELFAAGRELLAARGVTDRLREMEQRAIREREEREQYLLTAELGELRGEDLLLFLTDEEHEEFE